MELDDALSLRGDLPIGRYCPIERTMDAINTRSAMLLLREAFYGATRFDEFSARTDLTDATTATKLRDLTQSGILQKQPYQDPGRRQRHAYVLTEAGRDLMPAVFALLGWGNKHDPPPYPPAMSHSGCGEPVGIVARCDAGHVVDSDEITVAAAGPFGLEHPQEP